MRVEEKQSRKLKIVIIMKKNSEILGFETEPSARFRTLLPYRLCYENHRQNSDFGEDVKLYGKAEL